MEYKKINVLVVPSDYSGVGYFRSTQPHVFIQENYPENFNITVNHNPNWGDLHSFDKFNIIHFHKGFFEHRDQFLDALKYFKENNIVTVMDIDDYWELGQFHPMNKMNIMAKVPQIVQENLRLVDYVTTTTDYFASKIAKFNPNVMVFPNAIDENVGQFKLSPKPSKRIRFGFVMGSSHLHDMEYLKGVTSSIPKDILDKMQFVLCGYDTRGRIKEVQPNGQVIERNIKPEEGVWNDYEKIVTNDFKIISPHYNAFLHQFIPQSVWTNVEDEPYQRCWTMEANKYYQHYNNVDVLLAPLAETEFNKCKSELKLIEAGFGHKAVICSDFGPYQIGTVNLIEKGGIINPNGNAILIPHERAHKDWAKNIIRLVKSPELIQTLSDNLYNTVKDKYSLKTVCQNRVDWYNKINKK